MRNIAHLDVCFNPSGAPDAHPFSSYAFTLQEDSGIAVYGQTSAFTFLRKVCMATFGQNFQEKKPVKTIIRASVAIATVVLMFSVLSFGADTGGDVYKAKCAVCHGADGKGDTVMGKKFGVKDLGSAEVQKVQDSELNNIITSGKEKMPAYKDKLTGDQIQDLVKYIRTLKK
jgi:cytochrome c553